MVHGMFGGSANRIITGEIEEEEKEKAAVIKEEKETGGNADAVGVYDSDSSSGGIALSPSDLEMESSVVIKTGDEEQGWKRK